MNASQQAQNAYSPTQHHIRTPRSIEAQAFANVTSRLRKTDQDYPAMVQAIHDNRNLWSLIATDVAGADNGLTEGLRAQIFYLAEFTELHSQKVLRQEADASALVDINTAMMRGLNGQAGEA